MIAPSTYADQGNGAVGQTGIIYTAVPGDVYFGVEYQRTTDPATTGAEQTFVKKMHVAPSGTPVLDVQPLDGVHRYYRARAYDAMGTYAPSAWLPWSCWYTPVPVPNDYLNAVILKLGVYPLALNSSNLALSSGVLLTTPASSGIAAIVKTYIEPYTGFNLPASTVQQVGYSSGFIYATSSGPISVRAAIHPPVGVSWSSASGAIGGTVLVPPTTKSNLGAITFNLLRSPATDPTNWGTIGTLNVPFGLAGVGGTSGGWVELPGFLPSAFASVAVTTGDTWALEVWLNPANMSSSAGAGSTAYGVNRVWVQYNQPSYDATR